MSANNTNVRWKQLVLVSSMGLVGILALSTSGYRLSFHGWPFVSVVPNSSSVEGNGVRVTMTRCKWESPKLIIDLAIEYTDWDDRDRLVFNHPAAYVQVLYWDA